MDNERILEYLDMLENLAIASRKSLREGRILDGKGCIDDLILALDKTREELEQDGEVFL